MTSEPMYADAARPIALAKSRACAVSAAGGQYVVTDHGHDLEIRELDSGAVAQQVHVPSRFQPSEPLTIDRAQWADADRKLVVAGEGRTVLWNIALKVVTWKVDEDLVDISRDGATLLTETALGLAGWDLTAQRSLGELDLPLGHPTRKLGVEPGVPAAFSPDGKRLAVGTAKGTIELIDVAGWKIVGSIAAHETEVTAVAWRPDGKLLATGSTGGGLAIWQMTGATPIRAVTVAIGRNVLPEGSLIRFKGEPAPGSADPDAWIALFPDGSVRGNDAGRAHVAERGASPIGTLGTAASSDADPARWAALFAP